MNRPLGKRAIPSHDRSKTLAVADDIEDRKLIAVQNFVAGGGYIGHV